MHVEQSMLLMVFSGLSTQEFNVHAAPSIGKKQ